MMMKKIFLIDLLKSSHISASKFYIIKKNFWFCFLLTFNFTLKKEKDNARKQGIHI